MARFWIVIIALSLAIMMSNSATISCPTLYCNTLTSNYWYSHSGTNPVTDIYLKSWKSKYVCPLVSGKYAWINAPMQQYSSGTTSNSQVYQKFTSAECIHKTTYYGSNLNNGRKWIEDEDCRMRNCKDSTWKGKEQGEPCTSHFECDPKLSCRRSYIWPYATTCQSWASSGSYCLDDYDCDPNNFCWYESASDASSGTTKCMLKYSGEQYVTFGWKATYSDNLKDAIHNGRYWRSGWAYNSATNTATCMSIQKITNQSGTTLSSPYQCDPTDTTNKCRYYADSTNYVETECEWGLDGNGYCPKPSQTDTTYYTTYIKYVYGNSTCHTLDKDNLSAQTECGIGNGDEWRSAVEYKFNFDYYPFLQGDSQSSCIKAVFPDSIDNIDGSFASLYSTMTSWVTILLIIYLTF